MVVRNLVHRGPNGRNHRLAPLGVGAALAQLYAGVIVCAFHHTLCFVRQAAHAFCAQVLEPSRALFACRATRHTHGKHLREDRVYAVRRVLCDGSRPAHATVKRETPRRLDGGSTGTACLCQTPGSVAKSERQHRSVCWLDVGQWHAVAGVVSRNRWRWFEDSAELFIVDGIFGSLHVLVCCVKHHSVDSTD